MNANLTKPPKFLAVFSKRENTRRASLSHPMSRSTMLRRRYAFRSNFTGRSARSSFSLDGMTGWMFNPSRDSSIQSARYPLSPPNAIGQAIGYHRHWANWICQTAVGGNRTRCAARRSHAVDSRCSQGGNHPPDDSGNAAERHAVVDADAGTGAGCEQRHRAARVG